MNVAQLCKAAGISRQWLNKLVDLGEVPGVTRKQSGRLQIADTPDLRRWIAPRASLSKTRVFSRDELRRRRTNVEAPLDGKSYTSKELAQAVECTISSINQRVLSIPGAYFDDAPRIVWNEKKQRKIKEPNQYRFTDSPALRQWIGQEQAIKAMVRKSESRISDKPAFMKVSKRILNVHAIIRRLLREYPLKTWASNEIKSIMREIDGILTLRHDLELEVTRRSKK